MIKQLAWNTFKNTGNINTFLELREVENIQQNLNSNILKNNIENQKVENYGDNKDQGNSYFRK